MSIFLFWSHIVIATIAVASEVDYDCGTYCKDKVCPPTNGSLTDLCTLIKANCTCENDTENAARNHHIAEIIAPATLYIIVILTCCVLRFRMWITDAITDILRKFKKSRERRTASAKSTPVLELETPPSLFTFTSKQTTDTPIPDIE